MLSNKSNQPKVGLITTGLLMGLVLSSIDQTIVSTAMPTITRELGGLSLYSWVFSIYMLASTTTMPIYGKLADLFGGKKLYLIGLSLFLAGSALCGFAGDMIELILFRGIQGLGAGALMPIAFTIIANIYPPEKIGKFQGLFSAVFAVSSVIGPALGGFIVENLDWGWIFFLNLPIGIPALIIVLTTLQENKNNVKRSIDWFGAATLCIAIVSILLALVLGSSGDGNRSWGSPLISSLFIIGAITFAIFIWIESKVKEPIIPLHLFKFRVITFGSIIGFFITAGLFGAIAYIPLFVQGVVGASPSVAGYILMPLMLSTVITSNVGGRLMSKVSYRAILLPSLALMAIGFYLLSQMTINTTSIQIVVYMIVIGLGMGAIYPTIGTAAVRAVDYEFRGVATSSTQFFRSIGGTIGVSVLGSLLAQQMGLRLSKLSVEKDFQAGQLQGFTNPQLLLDSGTRASLTEDVLKGLQNVFSHSLNIVFLVSFVFVCVSLIACFFMGNARLMNAKPAAKDN